MKMKNNFAATITKEEIQKKKLIQFEGKIHIIDDASQVDFAINKLKKHSTIGFDTETKPSFKKGQKNKIAILQLSTENEAFLFRIHRFFPIEIISILEDENINKVGTAIRDDILGLKKYHKFTQAGFVELQDYVNQFNIEANGLKKIAAIVLDSRISKNQQTSNWENVELSEAQQIYAATDAWICLAIYNKLNNR